MITEDQKIKARIRAKEWYYKNKIRAKATMKSYRDSAHGKQKFKEYYKRKHEHIYNRAKRYRENHKQQLKEWYLKNLDKRRLWDRTYRHKNYLFKKEQIGEGKCPKCGKFGYFEKYWQINKKTKKEYFHSIVCIHWHPMILLNKFNSCKIATNKLSGLKYFINQKIENNLEKEKSGGGKV